MLRLVVHPEHPEPRKLAHAVASLARGGVVAYPTDTVYAIGCDFAERKAIDRIYAMKRMQERQPLTLLLPDLGEAARFGVITDAAYRLMKRLLPGPYTFVLEATREVPRMVMGERRKRRTVGLRVLDHPVALALLRSWGKPILSTSATGDEHAGLGDPNEVRDRYGNDLDVLVDGGYTDTDVSTVVSLIHDEIEVIRAGKGSIDALG